MMRKSRLVFTLSVMLISVFALHCPAGAEAVKIDKTKWPERVVLGGSVLGGPDYIIASGIANILTKKLGLDIVVQATPGTAGATRLVNAGLCELGMSVSGVFIDALKGAGWTKGKKYPDIRLLLVTYSKIVHFWTPLESGIKDIMDLNGKRVNLSKAGSTADIVGRRIFKLFNIKPKKITNVTHSDANNLIRDGLIDAATTVGLIPQTGVKELSLTNKINVIGLNEEQKEKMKAAYPYLAPAVIPKGTYKGVDYDVHSLADMGYFITNNKIPVDFAYMVTKTVLENLDMLLEVHKGAKTMKLQNIEMARGPLHKGAYLYYEEKGLPVPNPAIPID